jgi:hyperosmotically inducible periplasmic protein
MTKLTITFAAVLVVSALLCIESPAQEGLGQRIGQQIDEGAERLASEVKRGWEEIRESVDKLEVEGRVYSRLHWDKQLAKFEIQVESPSDETVVLVGRVTDQKERQRAVQLAKETVGVKKVVDRLVVGRAG